MCRSTPERSKQVKTAYSIGLLLFRCECLFQFRSFRIVFPIEWEPLCPAQDLVHRYVDGPLYRVELFALARTHGHLPLHSRTGISALVGTMASRIGKDNGFSTVQQRAAFGDIGHKIGRVFLVLVELGAAMSTAFTALPSVNNKPWLLSNALTVARMALAGFCFSSRWQNRTRCSPQACGKTREPGTLAFQQGVKKSFFHRWVRQTIAEGK